MSASWVQRIGILVLLVGALGSNARLAPVQEPDARGAFLEELVQHAAWCAKEGLLLERVLTLERVIAVDPDHAEARRLLGYKHERDGSWSEPRSTSRPKNRGEPEALTESGRLLAEIQERYLARLTERLFD